MSLETMEVKVTCPYCERKINHDWKDIAEEVSRNERGMGLEVQYSVECEEFRCPECGKNFRINDDIWEYPEGVLATDEIKGEKL